MPYDMIILFRISRLYKADILVYSAVQVENADFTEEVACTHLTQYLARITNKTINSI